MDGIRPDEIKKHAIAFLRYKEAYQQLVWNSKLSPEYKNKSDEQLYDEFVEGKQVSL